MNLERLEYLAQWLEDGAQHKTITFDMRKGIAFHQIHPLDVDATMACGSSCCIAGAACQFFNDVPNMLSEHFDGVDEEEDIEDELPWSDVSDEAMELLGLDDDQADALFRPHRMSVRTLSYYNDPQWAARVIRGLMDTGAVDWGAHEHVHMLRTDTVARGIRGRLGMYTITLDFFVEDGEQRCFGNVSLQAGFNDEVEFTGSLELVTGRGILNDMGWAPHCVHDMEIDIPQDDIDKLTDWAHNNGY